MVDITKFYRNSAKAAYQVNVEQKMYCVVKDSDNVTLFSKQKRIYPYPTVKETGFAFDPPFPYDEPITITFTLDNGNTDSQTKTFPDPNITPDATIYSATSPFNIPVNKSLVHPSSSAIVSRLMTFSVNFPIHPSNGLPAPKDIIAGIRGADDWNTAWYYADADDPLFTLYNEPPYGMLNKGLQFRIPYQARIPQQGATYRDSSAVFVQSNGREIGLYEASINWSNKTISAVGGYDSVINADNHEGIHLENACAASFGMRAGHIQGEELAEGRIPHALIWIVDCSSGVSVEPATFAPLGGSCVYRHGTSNTNAPAMGQRFFLNMTESAIRNLPVQAWEKTIMVALAEFGAFVRDTGGGLFKTVSNESFYSIGAPDPLVEYAKSIGLSAYNGTYRFKWSPFNWGANLKASAN
jgi:hypothetical protein